MINATQQQRKIHFEAAFADAATTGYIVECGVGLGWSLRWITNLAAPNQKIFGFDSFDGLPEDWIMSDDLTVPSGYFKCNPPNIDGVEYRVGLFEDTLPIWKQDHPGRIAFLHVDADLYSSCVTVLSELNDQIVPGTVIVFDEMFETIKYKNWEQGEYKAFNEWKEEHNRKTYQINAGEYGEASFRILQ